MERDWNSWDDSPRTVNEHIEQYRQKLAQPNVVENNEPAVDFFQVSMSFNMIEGLEITFMFCIISGYDSKSQKTEESIY